MVTPTDRERGKMSILPLAIQELAFDKLSFELLYEEQTGKSIELDTTEWSNIITQINFKVDTYLDGVIHSVIAELHDKEN